MKRLPYIFVMTALSMVMTALCIAIYWILYPYKPIKFNKLPHFVENKQVKSGEYLVYQVDYCKSSKVIPLATKTFNDGLIYNIPDTIATEKQIGCGVARVQIYVPKGLPKGRYFIEATYRYKVNPLRTIDIKSKTEKFEVI